jgi:2-dehydro-3-deoxyphosphogluconate aldolase/(4S)-4-hydroxy-2-oxoglutarate aldolase
MKIREILAASPVVPVIVVDRLEQAVPLAQALVDGGLPVLEVTLRSGIALQAIHEIAVSVSSAIVGAGTVTRPEQLHACIDAGARFAVSPGLTDELIAASADVRLPFLPGVFTPSEVMRAYAHGFDALKLFPAMQAGGLGMLKAMHGPLPDAVFCPTGGIDADNFVDFLALPNVACVGGSWVCPADAIRQHDWERVRRLAGDAHAAIERAGKKGQ